MNVRLFGPRAALACYLLLLLAYLGGAVVPLMDEGAARHAAIALHIYETGDWTRLIAQGKDYLDTPHLLFWLSALSFEVFGVDAVAYKLPSLLFSILAVYSTTRLGELLYGETAGRLAGVILASGFFFMLANNDARTEAMLTGSIIFAAWQLIVFASDRNERTRPQHLIMAGAGLALGFAVKGAIGIAPPLAAVFLYLVYCLDWKRLFDPNWLLLPPVVLLFVSPVLYAYFDQFGAKGVAFILWGQSLERLAEEQAVHAGGGDPFFYYHSFLWAFLPWSLLALWSIASSAKRLIDDRYWPRARGDAVTLGMIAVAYILFALSRFRQLHYLHILLPFFAIQLGGWLPTRLRHPPSRRWLWRIQFTVFGVLAVAAFLFNGWMFPMHDWRVGVGAATSFALGIWAVPHWTGCARLASASTGAAAALWLLLNFNFYPRLLEYQAGSALGGTAATLSIPAASLYFLEGGGRAASFDIVTRRLTPTLTLEELGKRDTPAVLFVSAEGRELIEARGFPVDVLAYSPDYHVSRLKWAFLNPNTRVQELGVTYLLRVKPLPDAAR
ncbi:MAG: glycosyltransferase family 39 protein [Azoarcus sp.]|jgi:4-amino-4-deoxy-L-arabinose transferase-like glycosyltransferase|nr:glycosyltransferase family 39 protein [Azoarcus sp.]